MNAAGEAYGQVSLARLLPLRAVTGELRAVPQSGRWSVTKTCMDAGSEGCPFPEGVPGMPQARAGRPDQTAGSAAPHRDTAPRDVMVFPQLTRASGLSTSESRKPSCCVADNLDTSRADLQPAPPRRLVRRPRCQACHRRSPVNAALPHRERTREGWHQPARGGCRTLPTGV